MRKELFALGINGSPRRDGTTAELLKIALKGAKEEGAKELKTIYLVDYSLPPCEGCASYGGPCNLNKCVETGGEKVKEVMSIIIEADVLFFATPVYWFGPSGLMKNLIDRLTCLEHIKKMLDGKAGGILCTCEEEGASLTIGQLFLTLSDMGLLFPPYAYTYNKGLEISPDTEFYAYQMGRNAVVISKAFKERRWWSKDDFKF